MLFHKNYRLITFAMILGAASGEKLTLDQLESVLECLSDDSKFQNKCYLDQELRGNVMKAVSLVRDQYIEPGTTDYRAMFKTRVFERDHNNDFVDTINVLDNLYQAISLGQIRQIIDSDMKKRLVGDDLPDRYIYLLTKIPDIAFGIVLPIIGKVLRRSVDLKEAINMAAEMVLGDMTEPETTEIKEKITFAVAAVDSTSVPETFRDGNKVIKGVYLKIAYAMGMLREFVSKVFTDDVEKRDMMELFGLAIPAALSTASEPSPRSLRREQRDESVRMEEELETQRLEAIRVAEEEREALRFAEEQERLRQKLEEESRAAALREQERLRQQFEDESQAAALRVAEELRRAEMQEEEKARLAAEKLEAERIRVIGQQLASLSAEAEQIMAKAEYQPGSFTRVGGIRDEICGSSHPGKDAACESIRQSSAEFRSRVLNQFGVKIQGVRERLNAESLEGLNRLDGVEAEIATIKKNSQEFEEIKSEIESAMRAIQFAKHLVSQSKTIGETSDTKLRKWLKNHIGPRYKDLANNASTILAGLISAEVVMRDQLQSLYARAKAIESLGPQPIDNCAKVLVDASLIQHGYRSLTAPSSKQAVAIWNKIPPVLETIRSNVFNVAKATLEKDLTEEPRNIEIMKKNVGAVRDLGLEGLNELIGQVQAAINRESDHTAEASASTASTSLPFSRDGSGSSSAVAPMRNPEDGGQKDTPLGDAGIVAASGLGVRSNQPASSATQPALATERGPDVDSSASSPGWGSTAWGILTNPVGSIRNAAASIRNAATSIRGALEGAVATGGIADSMGI